MASFLVLSSSISAPPRLLQPQEMISLPADPSSMPQKMGATVDSAKDEELQGDHGMNRKLKLLIMGFRLHFLQKMRCRPINHVVDDLESSMPQETVVVVHPAKDEEVEGDHTSSNSAHTTSAEPDRRSEDDPNRALSLVLIASALSIMCFTLLVQNSVGRELVLSLSYMCFFAAIFDLGFGYLMLFRRGEPVSMITTCLRFAIKLFILFALGTALFCSLMASIVRLHA